MTQSVSGVKPSSRRPVSQAALKGQLQLQHNLAHEHGVLCLCYAKEVLFTGSQDGTITVWDLEQCQINHYLRGHKAAVLAMTADATRLFRSEMRYSNLTERPYCAVL